MNITLEKELYRRLKGRTPPMKMSAYIAEVLAARLGPSRVELEAAYRAAAREPWRKTLAEEWNATETETVTRS